MAKGYTKRIGFLKKRPDLTEEQFLAHWQGTHAVLCQKIPHLRRYCVNFIDQRVTPGVGYDGFSELWFDSKEHHDEAFASPEGQRLLADIPNFVSELKGTLVLEQRYIWPENDGL
jgi:uncharacterized protein (TIGR02118 family)